MEAPVEIRYAGVVIGRAQEVRGGEAEDSFFLPGKEPMPVGTVVRLRSGESEIPARVLRAVESTDPLVAGMQVRLIGESEEVSPDWIPTPVPTPAKPKPGTPTPVVEVDVKRMLADTEQSSPVPAPDGAAVPEAVPVAVGSSLTGALEKAAESPPASAAAEDNAIDVVIDTPPVVLVQTAAAAPEQPPAEAAASAPEPEAPPVEAAARAATEEHGQASRDDGDSTAAAETGPTSEDLPPARPIAGPSGRRKTKRRRSQRS
jgi:hypothetical protein